MTPIIDPRSGDVEDDASSTTSRSLISIAGSMLVEISGMKLLTAWLMLLVIPALVIGLAPVAAIAWANTITEKIAAPIIGIWSLAVIAVVAALGLYAGRTLYRLAENNFWALNSVVIEPTYAVAREGLQHLGDALLPRDASQELHGRVRAAMALAAGLLVFGLALAVAVFAWRHSFWAATVADFNSMRRMAFAGAVNSVVLVFGYLAAAALFWGVADATLPQPRDLGDFRSPAGGGRRWRVAHLSDVHVVGERYGFRIETGRMGPRGNTRLEHVLSELETIHARDPLDAIVISGDVTDAGRSTEWAELLEALERHPRLAERVLVVPGNHDLNVVDRANPARVDLPTSPKRRLRQVRTLAVTCALQGRRVRVVDRKKRALGPTLAEALEPHLDDMRRFADAGRPLLSKWWLEIWSRAYPMIVPPDSEDGLGFILLNSNADTHFSFTNALGMVSAEQVHGIEIAVEQYPRACWVIALHHHLVEYPWRSHLLSERIGTALINGNWFVRSLLPLANRVVVMHGHRHVDWIGECAGLTIVSAPSPVMDDAPSCFYIHTLVRTPEDRVGLLPPERITVAADGADGADRPQMAQTRAAEGADLGRG